MALLLSVPPPTRRVGTPGEKAEGPSLVVSPLGLSITGRRRSRRTLPPVDPLVYHGHERERRRDALMRRRARRDDYGVLARDSLT